MREIQVWVTGLQRIEYTNKRNGELVSFVRVHYFGVPFQGKGEVGSEARADTCKPEGVGRDLVPTPTAPVKAVLTFEDREVDGEVYGRRQKVLLPQLQGVRVLPK